MIDLKKLRFVAETARFASITQAAGALNITQSALTRNIAEVEQDLGFPLFIRLPRGVQLTEAGADFVAGARRVVGDFETLLQGADDYLALRAGGLKLGVSPAGYQRFANLPLAELASDHPDLTLDVLTGSPRRLAPMLSLGELDAIVGQAAPLRAWPDLDVTPLARFHVAAMVRRNHPLLAAERIDEVDLLRYPLIMPRTVESMETDIARLYALNGLPPPRARYTTDDFDLTCTLVERTDAFALVISLSPGFGALGERFRLFTDILAMPPQEIAFATSRSRRATPAAKALGTLVERLLRQREPISP